MRRSAILGFALLACSKVRAPASHEADAAAPKAGVAPVAAATSASVGAPSAPVRCVQVGNSSVSRYGCTATVLGDGRVLLVGSTLHDASGPYSRVVEVWDPATSSITAVAPLHVGRAKHAAARLSDGRVLVVGGMSDEPKVTFSRTAEVFDPAANRWTRIASVPEGAVGQALATLADGRVVLAGGDVIYKGKKLSQVLVLDPGPMRWTPWPDAPRPRAGSLEPLAGERLLFSGNASTWWGDQEAVIDILDTKTRTWSSQPSPLNGAGEQQTARVAPNQVALFAEGGADGGPGQRVALFDDSLTRVRELPAAPSGSAVAVNGALYVWSEHQLFRADAGAWTKAATVQADGCSTAVPMPDPGGRGRLLFAGRCGVPESNPMGAIELCDL